MKAFALPIVTTLLALAPAVIGAQIRPVPDPPPPPTTTFMVLGNLDEVEHGAESLSGLVRGPDGKFYGTTNFGGGYGFGAIFSLDPEGNVLTGLYDFANDNTSGAYPLGLQRSRFGDYFYGTTSLGGEYGHGTIYRFTPPNQHEVLHSFVCDQGDPTGEITEGPDRLLYGTSQAFYGQGCGDGGVYKFDPGTREFKPLIRFNWLEAVGGHARGPLVIGADLAVYGTILDAYPHPVNPGPIYGGVFKVREGVAEGEGTIEFLHRFKGLAEAEGAYPASGLLRGFDGAMYGTTLAGGIACEQAFPDDEGGTTIEIVEGGTIFRITADGAFFTLYRFDACAPGAQPGLYHPLGRLLGDGAGRFIGATHYDWIYRGVDGIFEFDIAKTTNPLSVLQRLDDTTGTRPFRLALGATNYLYGATFQGGSNISSSGAGAGTVFGLPITPPLANWAPFALARQTFPTPVSSTIEATGYNGAVVHLTGEGSYDEDFDPLEYEWTNLPPVDETGRPARPTEKSVAVARWFPIGLTTASFAVRDPYHAFPAEGADHPSRMDVPIRVVDTQSPAFLTFPSDITVLTISTGAVVTFALPEVTDIADPAPLVACIPPSGTTFAIGVHTVACTATDFSHNTATRSFTVTVNEADVISPVVTTNPVGFIEVVADRPGHRGDR